MYYQHKIIQIFIIAKNFQDFLLHNNFSRLFNKILVDFVKHV